MTQTILGFVIACFLHFPSLSQDRKVVLDTSWLNYKRGKVEYVEHEIYNSDTIHVRYDGKFPDNIIWIEREQGDTCDIVEYVEYDKKGRLVKWNKFFAYKGDKYRDQSIDYIYDKGVLMRKDIYERLDDDNLTPYNIGKGDPKKKRFELVKSEEIN